MIHTRLFLALALVCASLLRAGETIPPAKEADIRKLLEATGSLRIGSIMSQGVVDQMKQTLRQNRPDLSAALIDSLGSDVQKIFVEAISAKGGLIDRIVPLYHRQFTHEEIRAILAFYTSPIGKRVSATLPQITQESLAIGQEWEETLTTAIQKRLRERLKEVPQAP